MLGAELRAGVSRTGGLRAARQVRADLSERTVPDHGVSFLIMARDYSLKLPPAQAPKKCTSSHEARRKSRTLGGPHSVACEAHGPSRGTKSSRRAQLSGAISLHASPQSVSTSSRATDRLRDKACLMPGIRHRIAGGGRSSSGDVSRPFIPRSRRVATPTDSRPLLHQGLHVLP